MRSFLMAFILLLQLAIPTALAGDADTDAARQTIRSQIEAFRAGDDALAYSFAAPNVKRIFPSLESFMSMVTSGYRPVHAPKSYAFGKAEPIGPGSIAQQVLLVGPDGKDYEALYTLELQPDGVYRITGVSLRAASTLST